VSFNTALTTKSGSTVLNFTGTRVDVDDTGDDDSEDDLGGGLATVALNTTNPTKPAFTFPNGTAFDWYIIPGHGYGVTAASMAALPQWGNEKWRWCVLATMAFAILA
jgi:hypothetical protein